MLYLTAILTGLLGSFHCLGMCGPIAMMGPIGDSYSRYITGRLLYNTGRIGTYSLIGLLFGAFGQGLQLAGAQQYISVIMGVLLLLIAVIQIAGIKISSKKGWLARYNAGLQKLFARYITKPGLAPQFTVGILNGLLPCGLVYMALAGAISTQFAWQGALYMALFGVGTLPMMLGVSLASKWITKTMRATVLKTIPYFVACIAVLFIIRGLNLGIPYLSPKISHNNTVECCEKPE